MDHIHDVNEYERIPHTQVSNVNFFLINLTYRPPHMHHDFEIVQVIEGGLHVKTLTEEFDLGPGEIALFNPDEFHTLHSRQSDCILLTIQADPSFCAAHYPAIQNIRFNTSNVKISGSAMNDEYQTKIGSVRDMLDKMYKDINDKHKKLVAEQSKA